ncbi:hypothetical protein [Amycolatopsis thermoflava]|uniref:hypothetical protein n=1 Tax=Amycolatopsis thermoflava TaxID=84480 RepID=UPI001ABF43F3|nr:hypothetical protein [Amycolatopsis thermoflava]
MRQTEAIPGVVAVADRLNSIVDDRIPDSGRNDTPNSAGVTVVGVDWSEASTAAVGWAAADAARHHGRRCPRRTRPRR